MINYQEQENQAQNLLSTQQQIIDHLKTTITFCEYSCVTLEIERNLNNIIGGIETKYFIQKTYAFSQIQNFSSSIEINRIMRKVQEKLTVFFHLIAVKKMNHLSYGLYNIIDEGRRRKKIQKNEKPRDQLLQQDDEEMIEKKRELEKLERKYNRLMGEVSILSNQLKGSESKKANK